MKLLVATLVLSVALVHSASLRALQKKQAVPTACRSGSPSGCSVTQTSISGYSAGTVIKITGGHDVYRSTDTDSCPDGWKIISPASQADWQAFITAEGALTGSPDRIIDVTSPVNGCGGCTNNAMNSGVDAQSTWTTKDGSPWWIRSSTFGEPNGDYTANCYLDIYGSQTNAGSIGFNDHNCIKHSTLYYCQRMTGGASGPSCGTVPSYANSKPANYKDARATRYDPETKKTVRVEYFAGSKIDFQCEDGYSTDGARDGVKIYPVECTEQGYFKPGGVCLKANSCGAIPNIKNAMPTGKAGVAPDSVQFSCTQGYSLDGEPVVPGGLGENRFFVVRCQSFGVFEKFSGECKPYAFAPSDKTTKMYSKAFQALFVVTCKGTVKEAFGKGEAVPVDTVCNSFKDANKGKCETLVDEIKNDFESTLQARERFEANQDKHWMEEHAKDRPSIADEAEEFCTNVWNLLEMPQ